jgi:O-antigen/teichoic acid export membrane protein
MFSFGSKLLCSGMINTIYENLYTLVIGKAFTASQVGFFNRGDHFAQLPTKTIQEMVVKVNYPILSSMQDDEVKLTATYKKLLAAPMFLLYPILTLLIVLAAPLVEVLIGAKWLPCVPILQIICIGCMFDPLTHINLNLLYVKGRTDLVLKLEFIKKPIGFLLLFVSIPFGVLWMCAGRSLYSFIAYVFNCHYTNKMIHYGFFSQMRVLLPILFRSVLMGIVVFFIILLFDNLWAKLLIGTLAGIGSYMVFCILSKDNTLLEVRALVLQSRYIQRFQKNN